MDPLPSAERTAATIVPGVGTSAAGALSGMPWPAVACLLVFFYGPPAIRAWIDVFRTRRPLVEPKPPEAARSDDGENHP